MKRPRLLIDKFGRRALTGSALRKFMALCRATALRLTLALLVDDGQIDQTITGWGR
jgi:hypothetical protein